MALRAASLSLVLGCAAQDFADEIRRDIDIDNQENDGVTHFPTQMFSASYVEKALSEGVDWTLDPRGVVTSVKRQGSHPWCGTYARVAAAEGQYALHSGHPAVNLSVRQIKDCPGNQMDVIAGHPGLMTKEDYEDAKDQWNYEHNHNVPKKNQTHHPCLFDASKVVPDYGKDIIGVTGPYNHENKADNTEDQAAAFIHHNGPVSCGVHVQALKNHDADKFVTADRCGHNNGIDHSVTCVGFGTDPVKGPYWKIKNSYGPHWGDHGFMKVARGVKCAGLGKSFGSIPVYKDIANYYETNDEVLV